MEEIRFMPRAMYDQLNGTRIWEVVVSNLEFRSKVEAQNVAYYLNRRVNTAQAPEPSEPVENSHSEYVWLVRGGWDYEGTHVIDIASSLLKARRLLKKERLHWTPQQDSNIAFVARGGARIERDYDAYDYVTIERYKVR